MEIALVKPPSSNKKKKRRSSRKNRQKNKNKNTGNPSRRANRSRKRKNNRRMAGSIPGAYSKLGANPRKSRDTCRFRGDCFIVSINPGANTAAGEILFDIAISPGNLATNSRLQAMSRLYEKYRFKKLKFRYHPSVGTTTNGSLIMAADSDVADRIVNLQGIQLIDNLSQFKHNVKFPVYGTGKGYVDLDITDNSFFNNVLFVSPDATPDDRWTYSGRFFIAGISSLAAVDYGFVEVFYDVEFYEPTIENTQVGNQFFFLCDDFTGVSGATYPWGNPGITTGPTAPQYDGFNNLDINFSGFQPGTNNPGSYVIFNQPGQYWLTSIQTGTAMTHIVLEASEYTAIPYDSYATNGGSTDTIHFFSIICYQPGVWVRPVFSGGHNLETSAVFISLSNADVSQPRPNINLGLSRKEIDFIRSLLLKENMSRMKSGKYPMKEQPKKLLTYHNKPTPLVTEDVALESSTTASVSGTITAKNGVPEDVSLNITGTTSTDGTIIGPDPTYIRDYYLARATMAKGTPPIQKVGFPSRS